MNEKDHLHRTTNQRRLDCSGCVGVHEVRVRCKVAGTKKKKQQQQHNHPLKRHRTRWGVTFDNDHPWYTSHIQVKVRLLHKPRGKVREGVRLSWCPTRPVYPEPYGFYHLAYATGSEKGFGCVPNRNHRCTTCPPGTAKRTCRTHCCCCCC